MSLPETEETKLERAIAAIEFEIEYYSSPGGYQEEEYYVRCKAKVDILEEILYTLRGIQRGE